MLTAEVVAYLAGAWRAAAGWGGTTPTVGVLRLHPDRLSAQECVSISRLGGRRWAHWLTEGARDWAALHTS